MKWAGAIRGKLGRVSRSIRNRLRPRGIILLYHRVAEVQSDPWSLSVTPKHFAEQLEALRSVARPLRLSELTEKVRDRRSPSRSVAVTFDDGYVDNLQNAKPLLERYEVPATVFVSTGYVDQDRGFWWDELDRVLLESKSLPRSLHLNINGSDYHWELGTTVGYAEEMASENRCWRAWSKEDPTPRHSLYRAIYQLLHHLPAEKQRKIVDDLLTWAGARRVACSESRPLKSQELLTLTRGSLIDIGSHTITHPVLSARPVDCQQDEIQQSKTFLETVLGSSVTSFAYPHGRPSDYTMETVNIVRKAGFSCACSTVAGAVQRDSDPFQLPRIHVEDYDGENFLKLLSRWLNA
jgi:peptidoglycan/xylan/chitin deacetylase (PgdA/CDA1 family)